jgi:hypothetical protein
MSMDAKRLERAADKIVDAIADMRVTDQELMYVAMYITIKSQPVEILYRMVELGEQIKWELNNNRQNRKYTQDELF